MVKTNKINKLFAERGGIGLMTIFNMMALYPMSGEALSALWDYEKRKKMVK